MEALAPYRAPLSLRALGDPVPLDYLGAKGDGGIDVTLEVHITSARMRAGGVAPLRLSRSNLMDLYWSIAQMVTHHASNGCNLRPGDCLLELTRRGADPVTLPTGEVRRFLEDGDEVTLRGYCAREGLHRIGLGECSGRVIG